jgi:hypothetical protein
MTGGAGAPASPAILTACKALFLGLGTASEHPVAICNLVKEIVDSATDTRKDLHALATVMGTNLAETHLNQPPFGPYSSITIDFGNLKCSNGFDSYYAGSKTLPHPFCIQRITR